MRRSPSYAGHSKRNISGNKRSPALLDMPSIGAVEQSGYPAHSSPDPDDAANASNAASVNLNQSARIC